MMFGPQDIGYPLLLITKLTADNWNETNQRQEFSSHFSAGESLR